MGDGVDDAAFRHDKLDRGCDGDHEDGGKHGKRAARDVKEDVALSFCDEQTCDNAAEKEKM